MIRLPGAGVELEASERGHGACIALIHDLASDARALDPLADRLSALGRVINYDRRGYGQSSAPQPYGATTVAEQAEDAAGLLTGLEVHGALVVGLGLGALVAMDLALRHAALVGGLVLEDVPLTAFSQAATAALSRERELLTRELERGSPEAAVAGWLAEFRPGGDTERAVRDHRAFFADFAGQASWPITRRELRAIPVPVALVTGPQTPAHIVEVSGLLGSVLSDVSSRADGDLVAATVEILEAMAGRAR